jgi:NAD(P)-dependent dehydrogenase (short-subunit alcohol dehydrogenase family)
MPEGRGLIGIVDASEGIGSVLVKTWAITGARLIASARAVQRSEMQSETHGTDPDILPLDVSDLASLNAAARPPNSIGQVDSVVHLAAVCDSGTVEEINPSIAAEIVAANVTGSFNVAQLAPSVLRADGQLALFRPVVGYFDLPQRRICSATKAGAISMGQFLRAEWQDYFDVRLVSPGIVDTRFTQRNDFNIQAMIPPYIAGRKVIQDIKSSRFDVHFPRRLTLILKALHVLPYRLSLSLTRKPTR